jgi:hypothetical protein
VFIGPLIRLPPANRVLARRPAVVNAAGRLPAPGRSRGSAADATTPLPGAGSPAATASAGGAPPANAAKPASAGLVDALGSDDAAQVERAVAAIGEVPAPEADPDALFAAARACEDRLFDPGRAAAMYERVVVEHPAARSASMAARRVAALRELLGPRGEGAVQAAALARLIASADGLAVAAVIARGKSLAEGAWPGAPTAALWLADWLRRTHRLVEAQAQYAVVVARWPTLPQGEAALRGGAGCAIEARNWGLAEALANRLPAADAAARRVREELLASVAQGRRRSRWYVAAWIAIAGALMALVASLAEAVARRPRGARRAALRPPVEVVFLAPVALVLVGVAFTAHRLIAPAVAAIAAGGLALSWLSGAALEALGAGGRGHKARSIAQVVVCLVGVAGVVYVALTREDLLETMIETVRFGPEG